MSKPVYSHAYIKQVKLSVYEGHVKGLTPSTQLGNSVTVTRHLLQPGVTRIPIREGRVRGTLFIPEGDGPFPGTIDMLGATGTIDEFRAGKSVFMLDQNSKSICIYILTLLVCCLMLIL